MAQPTLTSVHANRPLTNISVAYIQSQTDFLASRVFPIVPVEKQSDTYYIYTKGDWFRDEAQKRAPGTESAGSGYGLSTASYSCDVFALHKDVPDQVAKNTDMPMDPYTDASRFVTQRILLKQEKQWAADFFVTGVWGTSATPTYLWSNQAQGVPISDVLTAKRTIKINTGFEPNTMVVGYDVDLQLKQHPDIISRMSDNEMRLPTNDTLARIFGVQNYYVCQAVENTAAENETNVFAFVQGKHALLCYVAPSPGLLVPSAGYTFTWNGISDGFGTSIGIRRGPLEWRDAERIEAQVAFDNKLVATDLGYMFVSVVS